MRGNVANNRESYTTITLPDPASISLSATSYRLSTDRSSITPYSKMALSQKMQKLSSTRSSVAARPSRMSVRVSATHRVDRFSKKDIIVSPSILSANFATLGADVSECIKLPWAVRFHVGPIHCMGQLLSLKLQPKSCRSRPWTRLVLTGSTLMLWTAASSPTSPSVP